MSVLSEGEGSFIMGRMGKKKKVPQRRRPSVTGGSFGLFSSAIPGFCCLCSSFMRLQAGGHDRSSEATHARTPGGTHGDRALGLLFWTRPGREDVFALRLFFPGKQAKTRTWRHFNSPVLFKSVF